MWWSRGSAAGLVLLLAGCGFQPLYGQRQDATAAERLAAIRIEPLPDRSGQILYNHLSNGLTPLGRPSSPDYVLGVDLQEDAEELAFRSDETATRVNLTLTASFALTPAAGKDPVFQGVSRTTTAYNILASPYATLASEADARDRALRDIAREIRTRLAAFLTRQAAAP